MEDPNAPDPNRKVRASLLDRLLDDAPDSGPEKPPLRTQPRNRFAISLVRDLGLLLNTRSTKRFDVGKDAGTRSVLDYGVDDYTHMSPQSEPDRRTIEKHVREAITAFEPRLVNPKIRCEPVEGHHRQCVLRISAWLWAETTREPVSFSIMLDLQEGEARVYGR